MSMIKNSLKKMNRKWRSQIHLRGAKRKIDRQKLSVVLTTKNLCEDNRKAKLNKECPLGILRFTAPKGKSKFEIL